MTTKTLIRAAKVALWIGCLIPAAKLLWRAFLGDGLGANPIEEITHSTGFTALMLLMITLAVTPVRRFTGINWLIQLRRPLGLFAFFYAFLHFATYVGLDRFFDFSDIGEDILKRPYITVGFIAFLLLIPLAVTSTKGWIRKLGKRWTKLHYLIYPITALGILHYLWKEKADFFQPMYFGIALAILLLLRIKPRKSAPRTQSSGSIASNG